MIGRANLIRGAAGALLAVVARPASARKKKKRRSTPARCPTPPRCPASCTFLFATPNSDEEICGIGNTLERTGGNQCVPCGPGNPCVNSPHCLNSFTNLLTNQISSFTASCPNSYEFGVCGTVSACVTGAP